MSDLIKKEFALTTWATENRSTVIVLLVMITVGGLFSYINLPREAFPDVVMPRIFISTAYPGNSAQDIDKLITNPLEKELKNISGIDKITSNSLDGMSSVDVEFDFSVTTQEALAKVKDKVDIAKADPDWPSDLPADPEIEDFNISERTPILNINLSGDFSLDRIRYYAEYLQDEIEGLGEIVKVDIRGLDDKEVEIALDKYKMEALSISFQDVDDAISNENVNISAGDLEEGTFYRNIRMEAELKSMADFEGIVVKSEGQKIVYLRDITKSIEFKQPDRKKSAARLKGSPVVMLDVMKKAGENVIITVEKINKVLEKAKKDIFPPDLNILISNDTSEVTENKVIDLENNIIFGLILVTLVLMFFLGLRNALFVGIAIPLSMFGSFAVLGAMGITLNTMVLFALVMALGMLVDNGIVVVENVYSLMKDKKMKPIDAARQGVGEIAWPIISSTATTLAAFIPLAMWPGIMGEFMKYLPITLMIVLTASLLVALVFNPVLAILFMKVEEEKRNLKGTIKKTIIYGASAIVGLSVGITSDSIFFRVIGSLSLFVVIFSWLQYLFFIPATATFQNVIMPKFELYYELFLRNALRKRNVYKYFGGTILLLVFSVFLWGKFPVNVAFFPTNIPTQIYIYVEEPIGTNIDLTDKITTAIEGVARKFLDDNFSTTEKSEHTGKDTTYNFLVKSIVSQVGEGSTNPDDGVALGETPHKGKVSIEFVDFKARRGVSTDKVLVDLKAQFDGLFPGTKVMFAQDKSGPPVGYPISLEVSGSEDYNQILATADNLLFFIKSTGIKGMEELKLDIDMGKPQLNVLIDREKLRTYGVSAYQVGDVLRTALFGRELLASYKVGEDDYAIMLRFAKEQRDNLDILLDQKVIFRVASTGEIQKLPVSSVVNVMKKSTYSAVKRINTKKIVTLYSNIQPGYNANKIIASIQKAIKAGYTFPEGVKISYTGEQEKQAEEMAFLMGALVLALFMIVLILVLQFNSIIIPMLILTAVILSLIGVLLGLVISRMDFIIIMTMIGIISLAGIVVNNAIVLVDYALLLIAGKKQSLGIPQEELLTPYQVSCCLRDTGKSRLRPVLLTAITTILGLVPLAIGMNIDFINLLSNFDPLFYVGGDNARFWGPMAWTIIFGLTFATFLTLVIVPVMFDIVYRIQYRIAMLKVYKQDKKAKE